jgi:hypothetical protein
MTKNTEAWWYCTMGLSHQLALTMPSPTQQVHSLSMLNRPPKLHRARAKVAFGSVWVAS